MVRPPAPADAPCQERREGPVRPVPPRMSTEDDVRDICAGLPETSWVLSAGVPYFRVGRRGFAKLRQDPEGLVVFVPGLAEKESMLRTRPDRFFTAPHYDGEPALLVRLAAVDRTTLRGLLERSWRLRAPDELRVAYERSTGLDEAEGRALREVFDRDMTSLVPQREERS